MIFHGVILTILYVKICCAHQILCDFFAVKLQPGFHIIATIARIVVIAAIENFLSL